MKELTFREVIANIADGELWESQVKKIRCIKGNIEVTNKIHTGENKMIFNKLNLYTLARKKHSFTEAFKAYEEGKEIECCYGGQILKKENEKDYCFDYEKGKYVPLSFDETFFDITNIRSEWYIND